MTTAGPDGVSEMRAAFANPPKGYRPLVRWWWPGADVEEGELRREVALLDAAGFGGGEIQAFKIGLDRAAPDEARQRADGYRTAAFYAGVRAALEEARGRELFLDYTLGTGWPYGGGLAITPELAARELRYATLTLRGPSRFEGALPAPPPPADPFLPRMSGTHYGLPDGWEERLTALQQVVALVAVRGEAAAVDESGQRDLAGEPVVVVQRPGRLEAHSTVLLTDRVAAGGLLAWDVPPGTWQLFVFYQVPTRQRVTAASGAAPQLVLDHLNGAAMAAYLGDVGGEAQAALGAFFGHGLRAVFCDSLEVHGYLYWTGDFAAEFARRRGYALLPFLPVVKVPGYGEPLPSAQDATRPLYEYDDAGIGPRVRHDYWQTVSELMIERFYQPLIDWATAHGVAARIQAHGAPADIFSIYGRSHIPETEDLYASGPRGGNDDFYRVATSAASVAGRRIVSAEAFVYIGKAYQLTPETLKWQADRFLTAGVNQIIYHGFPYAGGDRQDPGWFPFGAPIWISEHVNQRNPFWEYLPLLNAYLTRLQYLGQNGKPVAAVALYRGELAYPSGYRQPELAAGLLQDGYAFDYITAEALQRCTVQDGVLVTPGGGTYGALLAHDQPHLPVEVAEALARLAAAGLPLLFVGRLPDGEAGYRDHEARTARIRALTRQMLGLPHVRHAAGVAEARAAVREVAAPNLTMEPPVPDISFRELRAGGARLYLFANQAPRRQHTSVTFPGVEGSPELWDPWTGQTGPIGAFERAGGVRLPLTLEPYGSQVVVFHPSATHPPRAEMAPAAGVPLPLDGPGAPWRLSARGTHLDGREHLVDVELAELVNWTQHPALRHFSGKGRYRLSFALTGAQLASSPRLVLDLGEVRDVAEVVVNGRPAGTLLLRPYRVEITALVQPGANTLDVTVTNTLNNRLVGEGRRTPMQMGGMAIPAPLVDAGLLGPVTLVPGG